MGTSSKQLASNLESLAKEQGGYFSASQAISIGYADSVHKYHVDNDDWIRIARGLYRLISVNENPYSPFYKWHLLATTKKGDSVGIFYGESALFLSGVTDTPPEKLEMIVPKAFRRALNGENDITIIKKDIIGANIGLLSGLRYIHPKLSKPGVIAKPKLKREKWSKTREMRDYNDIINAGED